MREREGGESEMDGLREGGGRKIGREIVLDGQEKTEYEREAKQTN